MYDDQLWRKSDENEWKRGEWSINDRWDLPDEKKSDHMKYQIVCHPMLPIGHVETG